MIQSQGVGGRVAVAEAVFDVWQAVEVVELPDFVSRVSAPSTVDRREFQSRREFKFSSALSDVKNGSIRKCGGSHKC